MSSSGPKPKKAKRLCIYHEEWQKEYPYAMPSEKFGKSFIYCSYCKKDISIGAGGVNDLKRHAQCNRHMKHANAIKLSGNVGDFFAVGQTQIDQVSEKDSYKRSSINII